LVPGPGLEPGYSAPKADVLPIRRSRKRSQILPKFRRAAHSPCGKSAVVRDGPADDRRDLGTSRVGDLAGVGPRDVWPISGNNALLPVRAPVRAFCYIGGAVSRTGEVAERFKAHAWKACVG